MAIVERVVVEVASVEVNDSYQVELRQIKKRAKYSPTQTRELARMLLQAANEADVARTEDLGAWQQHKRAQTGSPGLFDQPF